MNIGRCAISKQVMQETDWVSDISVDTSRRIKLEIWTVICLTNCTVWCNIGAH